MEPINIAKILHDKNPRLARLLPRFVVQGIERLIILDRINYVLQNYGDKPPMEFISNTLDYMNVSFRLHGGRDVAPHERLIFASNHPLGGLDGLILALALDKYAPNGEKFIVNDILMNLKPLASIFVPVNKHGRQGGDYARQHEQMYRSDQQVITFPAGLCSRLIDGRVQDTPWRTTFVHKAIKYNRKIVPVYIDGLNSPAFYRLALWRKRIKIGANIEMLLLPRQMFGQSGKKINIYIGSPVAIDDSRTAAQWAEVIRKKCYELNPRKG